MSHFTVGVIVKNKEELASRLAPYCEFDESYYTREYCMDKTEYIENYRYRHGDTKLTDEEIWAKEAPKEYDDIEDDIIYTSYNPDAKYDWYELGGRWSGKLIVPSIVDYEKGGQYGPSEAIIENNIAYVDAAQIKDILWDKMNEVSIENMKALSEFWDGYVLQQNPEKDYDAVFYKPEYYKDLYGTKENYIKKSTLFYTHDLLLCPEDWDSEWITMGDMGWFGIDSATEESTNDYVDRFYKIIEDPQYADYWFIVIDCHI